MKKKSIHTAPKKFNSPSAWTEVGSSHKSLNKTVIDALRKCILCGEFKPGDRLTEVRLAEMFNVSRNPIREALHALHAEGIVEIEPRKGARVPFLSIEEINEIIELRAELEGMSAKYAAGRCTPEARLVFQALLDQGNNAQENIDLELLKSLNQEFHKLLADTGKNRFLASFMRSLHERPIWVFVDSTDERIVETWKEHAAILQAVISSDEQLSAALAVYHIKETGKRIIENIQARPQHKA